MAKFSTSFKKLVADHDGYAHILSGVNAGAGSGTGKLYIYAGVDPDSADAALTGQTQLGVITGLAFAAIVAAVLSGDALPWSTVLSFAGSPLLASYARFVHNTDSPTAADSGSGTPRIHMSIAQYGATPGDINMSSTTFNTGDTFTLDAFQINL